MCYNIFMIDTLEFFEELKETLEPSAAKKIAELMGKLYREVSNTVTKDEFNELKLAVLELAEAQKRTEESLESFKKSTEENFKRVWEAIEGLTRAQEKSEQRLTRLEAVVEELVEAQKKTEKRLTRLEAVVEELAEAQKRTEQRVEELAEAQKRTEQRVEELAQAQKKTEQELKELAKGLKETRQMVGNLSDTVGYGLEDRAIKSLPDYLKRVHGIAVKGNLVRKYVKHNGRYDELNIYGEGKRKNKKIYIIGEAKSQLSRKQVDRFLKLIKRLEESKTVGKDRFLFMITYTVVPEIEEYAREKGVEIIWSYEI